mgnify:CR=1 FL=1
MRYRAAVAETKGPIWKGSRWTRRVVKADRIPECLGQRWLVILECGHVQKGSGLNWNPPLRVTCKACMKERVG